MPTGWSLAWVVALILCITCAPAAAQAQPDLCAGPRTNPPDTLFVLSLKGGQTVFQEGEIVGLTLAFTSSATGKYSLDTRNYDRSGRLNAETFCVEPAAGRDPLDDYFGSGLMGGFIGGGLGGYQPLTTSPSAVQIELNEWRLLPPGHYRLRLGSGRIHRSATAGEPGGGIVQELLWSNIVEFEVISATAEWQAAQLAAATKALDSGSDDATKRPGARILRFLGSEAATRELAKRFYGLNGQPFGWEFMFGLIASPHRKTAIEAMKAAIFEPSHPITREFVSTLALLEVQANPEYRLPPYSAEDKDAWMKLRERKLQAYQRAMAVHFDEVSAALAARTGAARAITATTLLSGAGGTIARDQVRQILLASWDSLPLQTRNDFIQGRWSDIAGPEMLPILRRIVNAPRTRGRPPDQPDREPALARLFELAPGEGREVILSEMFNPRGDIGIRVLGRLPDQELPEIEGVILARLNSGNGFEVDYHLLERYGTPRSLDGLRGVYERSRGRWACAPQTAMLKYFLRVDRRYGIAQVADALLHRDVTGCYTGLFGDLKDALTIPDIERLAIGALNDPSPEVVRNAAEGLGRYGSAAAEAALWARLERFHEAWKDRYDELRAGPTFDPARAAEGGAEYALMHAIAGGEAWIVGTEKLERLRSLVNPRLQKELAGPLAAWQRGQFQLSLTWYGEGRLLYDVAAYSGDSIERLVRKLKQFPPGSRFDLSLKSEVADLHRAEVESIQAAAQAAGLVLEIKRF